MASAYKVDPDALFSDEEDEPAPPPKRGRIPGIPRTPSPKRARVTPTAPRAPSLSGIKLPSYGKANLSGRPAPLPANPYSSVSSRSSAASNPNPYTRAPNSFSRPSNPYNAISRPSYGRGRGGPHRATGPSYNPPIHPPRSYGAPGNPYNDQPPMRGPMGRGRAATLPAHITRGNRPHSQPPLPQPQQQPRVKTQDQIIEDMAAILPEADRERFIQEKKKELQEKQANAKRPLPSARKRRRRPDEESTQKILANLKNSRKGTFKGLDSLLKAAQTSNKPVKLENSKHRTRTPEKAHSVYASATMTKEMIEREERERRQREIELEEEQERIHMHFREMREREKEDREWLSRKWRKVETVAAGMRHAYRLARHERALFAEEGDAKRRSLEHWGMSLLPVEENEMVTELLTIHVEEI